MAGALEKFKLLARATQQGSSWTKGEAQDAITLVRYALAIVAGLVAGIAGLKGLYIFLGFVGFNYTIGRMWMSYQGIDDADFEDPDAKDTIGKGQPVSFEGFPQSISMFLLSWIVGFNLLHY